MRTQHPSRPSIDATFIEVVVTEPEPDPPAEGVVLIELSKLPAYIEVDRCTDLSLLRRVLESLC